MTAALLILSAAAAFGAYRIGRRRGYRKGVRDAGRVIFGGEE